MSQPAPAPAPTSAPITPQVPPPAFAPQPTSTGKRKRLRLVLGVVIAGLVLVGLVAVVLLATAPVDHTVAESFSISNPGDFFLPTIYNFTSPHTGTFDFSWSSTDGGIVTFTVLDSLGGTLYSVVSSTGVGSIATQGGGVYTFGIYDALPETVDISGTLHYSTPGL